LKLAGRSLADNRTVAGVGPVVGLGLVLCDSEAGFPGESNFRRSHFNQLLARLGLGHLRPYDRWHTYASPLLRRGVNVMG
jgi:hypothetical protein